VLPALQSLIAVQDLDTAADTLRRRLADIPAAEKQLDQQVALAAETVEQVKQRLATNLQARREFEKQVAVIDGRLSRFDEHKAAVKTNQEFTALLHEIETARSGKDTLEEQILGLLEEADVIAADSTAAESALVATRRETDALRQALQTERASFEGELAKLVASRAATTVGVAGPLLAKYEQLLKQRKMVAVAPLRGDICGACHVRLRPAVTQQVRRNAEIVTCDSCQRILYALPAPDAAAEQPASTNAS
jgi:predicted  nucleic acid-binding Zn-ribbon protein